MGEMPCLLGEFGLPFDLDKKKAYKTGDYSRHEDALSLYYDGIDENLLSSTIWNYTADNNHVMAQPEWVQSGDHPLFNHRTHLTAVGSGHSRHAAERNALGQLAAIFGARIQVDQRITESYREMMRSGTAATWTHDTAFDSTVVIAAGMDNLIGAEIGDFWDDDRGNSFALAVMNRAAIHIYSGRILGAFAGAFSGLGFITGGTNPRYVLDVDIIEKPVENPASQFVFSRMELSANLIDTSTGTVLLPYNFNFREGHMNLPEAENRTFISAERRINDEFRGILADYLSRLIPQR